MAMHYELPLYRATYKFALALFAVTKEFPREYKYSIGQDMRHDSMELIRLIICANKYKEERVGYLNLLQERFELQKMQIRMCFDMHVITIKQHASLSDLMENISKQITGWKQASVK